ncbi:MAG: DUF2244 domain-containing protein [Alphaproteobacteria bacterium]|nr:DUF2244 domain-containing protein [Alphaproteobacteria bacterium]
MNQQATSPIYENPPLFDALLRPHRSLNVSGVRLVVLFAASLALIPGLIFFAMGAWPVVGFLGLDVAALYWALSVSLRDGRTRERVRIWPDRLQIDHIPASGPPQRHEFNPFWVRFRIERDMDDNVTALLLALRDRQIEFARFLGPRAKAEFARDFAHALHRLKN